jgi:hypothetical protein
MEERYVMKQWRWRGKNITIGRRHTGDAFGGLLFAIDESIQSE